MESPAEKMYRQDFEKRTAMEAHQLRSQMASGDLDREQIEAIQKAIAEVSRLVEGTIEGAKESSEGLNPRRED